MLWILTQDKKSLINVKEVTIEKNNVLGMIGKAFFTDWSKFLGVYNSDDRALEVLHEIFMTIEQNNGLSATFTMPEK